MTVRPYVRTSVRPSVRPSVLPSVRTDSVGVGGESQVNPTGVEMPYFLGGKLRGAFGEPAFFLAGNRMTIVSLEKEVSLKA